MKLLVICYHYILSEDNPYLQRGIMYDSFEKQLMCLKKRYDIAHFSDLTTFKPTDNVCIITFDDGIKECYSHVYPLLQKMNMKAVFFISSAIYLEGIVLGVQKNHILQNKLGFKVFMQRFYEYYNEMCGVERSGMNEDNFYEGIYPYDSEDVRRFKIDLNYRFPHNEVSVVIDKLCSEFFPHEQTVVNDLYLSKKELIELAASSCVEIGSHAHSHVLLSKLSKEEQRNEIMQSLDFLEHNVVCEMPVPFSYPFGREGSYDRNTMDILSQDQRINYACSMARKENVVSDDSFLIHRFDVNDVFDGERFCDEFKW